jgi:hypothetical protein
MINNIDKLDKIAQYSEVINDIIDGKIIKSVSILEDKIK